MSFTLTVLGSNSAMPSSKRFPTAQVLNVHERFFLIDCGEGTQMQLRRFSINMLRIDHIFISHLHGDHIFGLFGILSSFNLMGRKKTLHIYAHKDLEYTLDHYQKYFGSDMSYKIDFHPFAANKQTEIYSDKHITVETVPLRHSLPCAGFIFREKKKLLNIRKEAIEKYTLGLKDIVQIKLGADYVLPDGKVIANGELTLPPIRPRSYAFCTDTTCFAKLAGILKDIDMLYFESTFSDKDKKLAKITGHSTASGAAELAKQANVGRLLIGHFSSRYKSIEHLVKEACSIFPATTAVEDGEKYPIEQKRVDSGS
jgi:ribonuclease Z